MEMLKKIIGVLKIISISIAGIGFAILMIRIAVEPEYKSKYIKYTKHLLIAIVLITVSLSLVEIPKHYYGSKIEIVDDTKSTTTIAELLDKDCQGRETINVDGKWYVVTDTDWTLYNYYGQTNTVPMSKAYSTNVLSTKALENVDVLRLYSECQGTFKGYFADIAYYRDKDGFIFPATYNYDQYQNEKNGTNYGGGSGGGR